MCVGHRPLRQTTVVRAFISTDYIIRPFGIRLRWRIGIGFDCQTWFSRILVQNSRWVTPLLSLGVTIHIQSPPYVTRQLLFWAYFPDRSYLWWTRFAVAVIAATTLCTSRRYRYDFINWLYYQQYYYNIILMILLLWLLLLLSLIFYCKNDRFFFCRRF